MNYGWSQYRVTRSSDPHFVVLDSKSNILIQKFRNPLNGKRAIDVRIFVPSDVVNPESDTNQLRPTQRGIRLGYNQASRLGAILTALVQPSFDNGEENISPSPAPFKSFTYPDGNLSQFSMETGEFTQVWNSKTYIKQ